MRLVLLSNATNPGAGLFEHAMGAIRALFRAARTVAFIPFGFARHQHAAYAARVQEHFAQEDLTIVPLTPDREGVEALRAAEAVFVGGGNTFRLLAGLQRSGLLDAIRDQVRAGMPYLGVSAGSNVAAPTIRTTNDMPIVELPSLSAIGLVPFQINPHYVSAGGVAQPMEENREARLREYLEENQTPVVALRDGAWIEVSGDGIVLAGSSAVLFRRDHAPLDLSPGAHLDAAEHPGGGSIRS